MNGGSCYSDEARKGFRCEHTHTPRCRLKLETAAVSDSLCVSSCWCPVGFAGQFCEVDVDDCVENNCENGTICVDGVGNYSCVCPHPFSGQCQCGLGWFMLCSSALIGEGRVNMHCRPEV